MTEAQEHLNNLNDTELVAAMEQAYADCEKAGQEEKESEWHQACFAGLMTYVFEIQKRGIVVGTRH